MLAKPIFTLLLSLIVCPIQQPGDLVLPDLLSEPEKQIILKETKLKPHVESVLKVAETRIKNAFRLAQDNQLQPAAQELSAFLALIIYSDSYTRKSPSNKGKDRNHCLKQIEQAIFKQSRSLEAVTQAFPLESREAFESQIGAVKKIRLRAINDLLSDGQVINAPN
jgi:hypothetical protein